MTEPLLWPAADDDIGELEPRSLEEILEAWEAGAPERARLEAKRFERAAKAARAVAGPVSSAERRAAGRMSKGSKGTTTPDARPVLVDSALLASLRGERSHSAFAIKLRIPRTTYQNIERTGRTQFGTAKRIAEKLDIALSVLIRHGASQAN